MDKKFMILIIIFILILTINFISASDVLVWQGQYYTGTTFNTGTYEFNFSVYDNLTDGSVCYSNTTTLTTGTFGDWKTEQYNVSHSCNNISKEYYLNINIDGTDQTPRRRLVVWEFLRKDVDEITLGKLQTASQIIAPIIQADSQIITPIVNTTKITVKNITTTDYGFFSYLGNPADKITKLWIKNIDVSNNISIGGEDRYLSSSGAGNLELAMTSPASTLNIKSGSGSGDSSEIRMTADSVYLTGNFIGLYGGSEIWGTLSTFSTSENALVISDDGAYDPTFRVDTLNKIAFVESLTANNKIQGNYYSDDGSAGITNTADYHVCTNAVGLSCNAWCTLRIKNGLIVGCT